MAKKQFAASIPMKRYATNEDVLFSASDGSTFITGTKLAVYGGMTMT